MTPKTWPLPSENEKGRDWGFCLPGKLEFFIEPFLLERGCCVGAYGEDALLTFLRNCRQQFWGGRENEVGWDHHAELPFQEWSLKLTSFEGGGGQGKKVGDFRIVSDNINYQRLPSLLLVLHSGWALCPLFCLCCTWERVWSSLRQSTCNIFKGRV